MGGSYFDINLINDHPFITFVVTLIILSYVPGKYQKYQGEKISKQTSFIEGYRFPVSLTHFLSTKYPHLDGDQIEEILENLRQFFMKNTKYRHKSAIVSVAVDHVWKEFSGTEPEYKKFCKSAFKKYLPYAPFSHRPLERFLCEGKHQIRLWISACQEDEIDPLFPDRLPRPFSLDERFKISGGSHYIIGGYSYSHILGISFAPTPGFLTREIEEKLSTQLSHEEISKNRQYLTSKLYFYICHDKWITKYFKSEINNLFNVIENSDELLVGLFGEFALFEEERRFCNKAAKSDSHNPNHPDYDSGCDSGCACGCSCGYSGTTR